MRRNKLDSSAPRLPITPARRHPHGGQQPRALIWMGLAFTAATISATAVMIGSGAGKSGVEAALRLTARLAFAFFWLAYVGGAVSTLFGIAFKPLQRRGREFGLAFATVLLVHLVLVGWLCWIGAAPSPRIFAIFGVGVIWTGLLALFSLKPLGSRLGSAGWWVLRNVGMTCILADFAFDFLRPTGGKASLGHSLFYAPFAALVVLAAVLRILAWLKPMVFTAPTAPNLAQRRGKPQGAENVGKVG